MSDASPIALQARYLFPVAGAPLAGGVVTILGERIVAVGANDSGRPVIDLGNVAIVPGLVNAHTHLEFSDLAAPLGNAGDPLPAWIRRVVAVRRARPDGAAALAIAQGLAESLYGGVTTIGEISTGSWPPAGTLSGETIVFHESLGLNPASIDSNVAAAAQHIERIQLGSVKDGRASDLPLAMSPHPNPLPAVPGRGGNPEPALDTALGDWPQTNLLPGLSPHAPYSVHLDLLAGLVRLAINTKTSVAMHVAESREELDLLATSGGPFRELLEEFGVWQDGLFGSRRPLGVLEQLARCQRSLVIHGNYLAADEIDFLGQQADRMSVVFCPRTHAFFGHEAYPLSAMLRAGVQVALGTDSRASNPDLSLWSEMRHVAATCASIRPAQILQLGTLAGARALGLDSQIGTLEVGKLVNLAIVPLPEREAADPHELLLANETSPTQAWWRGRSVAVVHGPT